MKLLILVVIALLGFAWAQDYADVGRVQGIPRRGRFPNGNRRGLIAAGVLGGALGGVLGTIVATRRANAKSNQDKIELLHYIQLQEEIYKQRENQWQTEYQKLYKAYEELDKEITERDYEEFKAPDSNNDETITRDEFDEYVKKYIASFPELSESDFPSFDEFDNNHDGKVSFNEWQSYLVEHKKKLQKENAKELPAPQSSSGSTNNNYNSNKASSSSGKSTNKNAKSNQNIYDDLMNSVSDSRKSDKTNAKRK